MIFGPWQIALLIITVIVTAAVAHWAVTRFRRKAWLNFAELSGFCYFDENGVTGSGGQASERDVADVQSFVSPLLQGGYHKHVLLKRHAGRLVMACDYVWYREISSGNSGTTRGTTTTVVAIRDPRLDLPVFRLQWKVATGVHPSGSRDSLPDITEALAFAQPGVQVYGNDSEAVSDLLTASVWALVTNSSRLVIEATSDQLILNADRRVGLSDVKMMMNTAEEIVRRCPA